MKRISLLSLMLITLAVFLCGCERRMVNVEYLISSKQYQCDPTSVDFVMPENHRDMVITFVTSEVYGFATSYSDALATNAFLQPYGAEYTDSSLFDAADLALSAASVGIEAVALYYTDENGLLLNLAKQITGYQAGHYHLIAMDYDDKIILRGLIPEGKVTLYLSDNIKDIIIYSEVLAGPNAYIKAKTPGYVAYENAYEISDNASIKAPNAGIAPSDTSQITEDSNESASPAGPITSEIMLPSADDYANFLLAVKSDPYMYYIKTENGSDLSSYTQPIVLSATGDLNNDSIDEIFLSYQNSGGPYNVFNTEIWQWDSISSAFELYSVDPGSAATKDFYTTGYIRNYPENPKTMINPYSVYGYNPNTKAFDLFVFTVKGVGPETISNYGVYSADLDYDDDGIIYYKDNEIPMTKDEYNALIDPYVPDKALLELNWELLVEF